MVKIIKSYSMADDGNFKSDVNKVGATPMHVRILEKSLDLNPFLNFTQKRLNELMKEPQTVSDTESYEDDTEDEDTEDFEQDKKIDQSIYYNFRNVEDDRKWLRDILLSVEDPGAEPDYQDENVVTEHDLQTLLKQHLFEKKHRKLFKQKAKYGQYKYYGASLLSKVDMYAENQKHNVNNLPKRADKNLKSKSNNLKRISKKSLMGQKSQHQLNIMNDMDDSVNNDENDWDDTMIKEEEEELVMQKLGGRNMGGHSNAKSTKRNSASNNPEQMAIRRRKLWVLMCKKEMGKVQRAKANNHKEQLQTCKRTAQLCMKVCRQKAMQSQKNMKETIWRCKRLTREMQTYWKRYDRVEREMRRRMEKEAEEQRKMDVEMIEAKRQQRKLNFLITQTELYAHFMSRKLGKASPEEQLRILSQLEEKKITRLAPLDDYNSDMMKAKAKKNVIDAIESDRARTKLFDKQTGKPVTDVDVEELDLKDANINSDEEHPQPSLFKGHLKGYQLKGMNWLANLYDQGISGILADEMGLGKTVQSIAFLCHVAEKYSVWGPFLVISPASTLHNWQQEMARFVPDFRVVPYWGNPNERKILRQFWEQKDLHTKEASFHVVITSYQIIITDFKYFNRIKWQYMILDEAQAIKSSSSVRWKMLLGFSCRNRLLLSGTPIQNSMAELWALLHFIMPTLFDSHDEFNEWFSKDIENHVENKTGIDEKHLSRLHMILKPFMLRRIKKDVENELSDKIEVMVYCPLTRRQKLLYMALKKKIRIEDLLHYTVGGGDTNTIDKNFTSNLMNLVMQFRKVCNHPELFERRDAKSPLYIQSTNYVIPKLIYAWSKDISKLRILYNQLYLWTSEYIYRVLHNNNNTSTSTSTSSTTSTSTSLPYNCFSFTRFINYSPQDMSNIFTYGILELCKQYLLSLETNLNLYHRSFWWPSSVTSTSSSTATNFVITPSWKVNYPNIKYSHRFRQFFFTRVFETESRVYTYASLSNNNKLLDVFGGDDIHENGYLNGLVKKDDDSNDGILQSRTSEDYQDIIEMDLPRFLFCYTPKVEIKSIQLYCSCIESALYNQRVNSQGNLIEDANTHALALYSNNQLSMTSLIVKHIKMAQPLRGWFNIVVPDKETLVTDAGKLSVLDPLLKRLKQEGHRVLIYSQMTKMIDLLEEYMWHRKHKYMRLDGSSKISERRDMVADFQARTDIFVFLLSTRAGGLGINLTAADTVIFYDSDWNPTVDQQAMDRAHRLGQTKQVTVYRLICKGTIEERILQRAREKSEIQRMVISGGNFKPDTLKPKEVVSLLLDDEEIEMKYKQKAEERKNWEEVRERKERDRKRKQLIMSNPYMGGEDQNGTPPSKRIKEEWPNTPGGGTPSTTSGVFTPESRSEISSPVQIEENTSLVQTNGHDDSSNDGLLDVETPVHSSQTNLLFNSPYGNKRVVRGGTRRGRPRGSRRGGGSGSKGREVVTTPTSGVDSDTSVGNNGSSSESVLMIDDTGESKSMQPIRRGPGRPRLKPVGPGNQGTRGVVRPRKPVRPLPVPLRPQAIASTSNSTNSTSTTTNSTSSASSAQQQTQTFSFYGSAASPSPTPSPSASSNPVQ
ncbi:chromatin-remodeling ATPase INO80 [Chrysoperla carnea]|uniref:chromatin-remodeling ATPase INO80 n=1 Tax=Chrysoperla carnea TaxID=189513 RepID=UPI001D095855|nr:chromatin-remodeling ATPase INO80 [Chrysoperla carnea]